MYFSKSRTNNCVICLVNIRCVSFDNCTNCMSLFYILIITLSIQLFHITLNTILNLSMKTYMHTRSLIVAITRWMQIIHCKNSIRNHNAKFQLSSNCGERKVFNIYTQNSNCVEISFNWCVPQWKHLRLMQIEENLIIHWARFSSKSVVIYVWESVVLWIGIDLALFPFRKSSSRHFLPSDFPRTIRLKIFLSVWKVLLFAEVIRIRLIPFRFYAGKTIEIVSNAITNGWR